MDESTTKAVTGFGNPLVTARFLFYHSSPILLPKHWIFEYLEGFRKMGVFGSLWIFRHCQDKTAETGR
jgi:hypothetical protein